MDTIAYATHDSPIGPLTIAASARGVAAIHMESQRHVPSAPPPPWVPASDARRAPEIWIDRTRRQLDDYFDGRRVAFDVPLDVVGTPFQRAVWQALSQIAFGRTITYGELARRIGNPNAVRAVGLANGRNPISVVVPCHRVIGADGTMTGYGGGVDRKRFLLALERRVLDASDATTTVVRPA